MSKSRCLGIGQVIKLSVMNETKISKVRLQDMVLDQNLLMYFPKKTDKWVVDFKGETKLGDIVVIKKSPEKLFNNYNMVIQSILYKVGETVDPVTGQRCRGIEFIDEDSRKDEQSRRNTEDYKITKRVKQVETS